MTHHPARIMPFADLIAGLEAAKSAGHVVSRDCPAGRRLYVYTNRCVYENGWNDFSMLARGLIVHPDRGAVVATPFPKFFNAGERGGAIPDLPFEVYEKVDGSLGILHHFDGAWRAATKGAFESEQAKWIESRLAEQDLTPLDPSNTYLVEAVYPENRIVVHYDQAGLVMLGAYLPDGSEIAFSALEETAQALGWRAAKRFQFGSFADLAEHARSLPANEEGFVIRYSNGLRLKLKGEEYRRIHSLISNCTPLAMWEAMQAGSDLETIRRELPEEFWSDFDNIIAALSRRVEGIQAMVTLTADRFAGATDKEIGLQLRTLDAEVQPLIFPYRKAGGKIEGRARDALFRLIRPTGNSLPGYTPSYAMHRIAEDAA